MNVTDYVPVSDQQNIAQAADGNPVMVQLLQYASDAWLSEKISDPEGLRRYWDCRGELHNQDGLVSRSDKLIIPAGKKSCEVLPHLHAAHEGVKK